MIAIERSETTMNNSGVVAEKEEVDMNTKNVSVKRRKVEFSEDVMLHSISARNADGVEDSKDPQIAETMYRRYVLSALEALDTKDSSLIDSISNQMSLPTSNKERISESNLNILLDILSSNVSRIDSPLCNNLILSIINFEEWYELPTASLTKYIFFIQVLCSSLPKWWQDISMAIISKFILAPEKTIKHHELIAYFIKTIPSTINMVGDFLVKFFPNKNDSKQKLVNYITNLLMLTDYCKELRFLVWSLLIEKIITLDVELQNELDELDDDDELEEFDGDSSNDEEDEDSDEEIENEENKSIILEAEQDNDNDEDGDQEEEGETYSAEVSQSIKELSSKLDSILSLLTSKLSHEVSPEKIESGEGVGLFNKLTALFKSHVLPTYYTKSIQYIMFYISQQQNELMDSFLVTLIDIAFSSNETSETKIKSLQYLGSYIARAKKVSKTQVIFVTSYLTSWLNRFVLEREEEVDQIGGMERFKQFYATFQALCYMFCFRHSDLKDADGNWDCELDKFFQRMVISKFNPLKYCNENVMMMFARITQHEGIAYCFGIIESNNNERLRGIMGRSSTPTTERNGVTDDKSSSNFTASTWSLVTRQQFIDLQSYFPFDPLFLKEYKIMMKDYYIEWNEASGDYESDDDSDD
ncbi:hypothetical protein TPHA_0G02920 [Tetrapisispora phaffii CBS 4417]|uniref:RNA polymerase I-specific transcription initiation factor RRN3 n=1 Tax=Tetrapisispora phaffii (strain ATCC 24235 / CBS 4417 / NBRC 1672 / NRRL Y-8282 / UCD 70-5) TaxID=1071381 RepID=G8BW55_TETPH|nr:hypothetical protein TPHA_0G02920 [Tetrapisispora phaffii CBS 4417]CCE64133.1 hypothetical protein TPHA_0G02920 [Tetrapisispora phaffii CBS 4417]